MLTANVSFVLDFGWHAIEANTIAKHTANITTRATVQASPFTKLVSNWLTIAAKQKQKMAVM